MSTETLAELDAVLALPLDQRLPRLASLGGAPQARDRRWRQQLVQALVAVIEGGEGAPRERVAVGQALGQLGDPRISSPEDPAYWVTATVGQERMTIGRYPVTVSEFRAFADCGAADDDRWWTPSGLEWLRGGGVPWSSFAAELEPELLVPNQPVVGVTWYEATAYAAWAAARLPTALERTLVARGPEKRPYPWGSPFGQGNANTREEVLGRPCAVGLFVNDRTPEGVCDLAGNAGEWLANQVNGDRVFHPGAWTQPSMAAWAKARSIAPPDARGDDLGFRLAKDCGGP